MNFRNSDLGTDPWWQILKFIPTPVERRVRPRRLNDRQHAGEHPA
jgi:hypothetical protein